MCSGLKKININHSLLSKTFLILHKLQYHLLKSLKSMVSSTVAAKALKKKKEKKPAAQEMVKWCKWRIHWCCNSVKQQKGKKQHWI